MTRNSSLEDVLHKANELYFKFQDIYCLSLADTNGMSIEVDDPNDWKLDQYYAHNHYQPSRHKMYVMYTENEQVYVAFTLIK